MRPRLNRRPPSLLRLSRRPKRPPKPLLYSRMKHSANIADIANIANNRERCDRAGSSGIERERRDRRECRGSGHAKAQRRISRQDAKTQKFWQGEDGHFISSTSTQPGEEEDREHEFRT